jgi:hypothetical protein
MSEHDPADLDVQAIESTDIELETKRRLRQRFFRALNYLSLYAYIIVVWGGALLTDYLLLWLIAWLLREDIARYPIVALWFDYARISLAFLLIILAVVHGILSTISQIKMDWALSRRVEEP